MCVCVCAVCLNLIEELFLCTVVTIELNLTNFDVLSMFNQNSSISIMIIMSYDSSINELYDI